MELMGRNNGTGESWNVINLQSCVTPKRRSFVQDIFQPSLAFILVPKATKRYKVIFLSQHILGHRMMDECKGLPEELVGTDTSLNRCRLLSHAVRSQPYHPPKTNVRAV
jgi:hypothetical protein